MHKYQGKVDAVEIVINVYKEAAMQGMSAGIYKQYYNGPNSFAETRLLDLSLPGAPISYKFKKSIHYCSSCILAHRKRFIRKSPCKMITAAALLPGMLLAKIIERKNT